MYGQCHDALVSMSKPGQPGHTLPKFGAQAVHEGKKSAQLLYAYRAILKKLKWVRIRIRDQGPF
jgi:hypothetical protein